jgi:hypothetical protein
MHVEYEDIRSRIDQPPSWWCEGIPRYGLFEPQAMNVYAAEAALVLIRCQSCDVMYHAGVHHHRRRHLRALAMFYGLLNVSDPPNACCDGTYATSYEIKILQFWERGPAGWTRRPEMERPLEDAALVGIEPPLSLRAAIAGSIFKEAWDTASIAGDYVRKRAILVQLGCEDPRAVVEMLWHGDMADEGIRRSQASYIKLHAAMEGVELMDARQSIVCQIGRKSNPPQRS